MFYLVLGACLACYLLLALTAILIGEKLVFAPPVAGYNEEFPGLISRESEAGDQIAMAYLAPANEEAPVVLLAHGNAEDLSGYGFLFSEFQRRGWGLLVYDYPGYGLSSGQPSETSVYAAADSAWSFLHDEKKFPSTRLIILGRSVGSGPATWLASTHEARALVLISPFRSAFRTVTNYGILPGDLFPNQNHIRQSTCPLRILHGDSDRIIPLSHGQALFELSPAKDKELIILENTGHNNIFPAHLQTLLKEIASL